MRMSKIVSLMFASTLTIVSAGLWLKMNVTESAAFARHQPVNSVPMSDVRLKTDIKLKPLQRLDHTNW